MIGLGDKLTDKIRRFFWIWSLIFLHLKMLKEI